MDNENKKLENAIGRVAEFFKDDEAKTLLWMNTKNPQLANYIPNEVIKLGRSQRLIDFINYSLDV